jgi:GT2 family glycosyltransferase
MLVRTDVFQEVGGFDHRFDPYGPEDLDFSLRVYNAGYHALYVPRSVIFHDYNETLKKEKYHETYARHKTRHWFLLMRRHASIVEQLGFILLGAPYVLVRAIIREGRKGNLKAVRGLLSGLLDVWESPVREEEDATHGSGKLPDHSAEKRQSHGDSLLRPAISLRREGSRPGRDTL